MNEDISARAWSTLQETNFQTQKSNTVPMTKVLKTTDTEELDH